MAEAPARKRILLVEDDPALRKLLAGFLRPITDFELELVGDGRAALKLLEEREFDLVCLDLMLPEVSGYDLCEHIRKTERIKHLPILVTSARALPEDRAHAEEVGASAYLTKPFARAEFLSKVRALLGLA